MEEMNFETPNFTSLILYNLYEQHKSNRFCDLTLYVNNKIIRLHRNVLACVSPYFDSILKQHKIVKEQLTISCLNNYVFDIFLNYIYTGKITINNSNVEEILKLANHFIVIKIIEYCTQFLEKNLNINNCLSTLDLVQRFNLKISAVDNLINSKLSDIINGPELLNLPFSKLQSFIKYEGIIISVAKQLDIFTRWVYKDKQNREKDFVKLLNNIQWISIDHNDISKHLDTCNFYSNSDKCLYNVLNTLIQNNILLPNYKNRYEELHYKYTQNFNESMEEKIDEKSDCPIDNKEMIEEKEDITVAETENTNSETSKKNLKMLVVRAKNKTYKQKFIRRLMLYGLKPNLKVASMKNAFCKKKISVVNIRKRIEGTILDFTSEVLLLNRQLNNHEETSPVKSSCLDHQNINAEKNILEVYSDEKFGVKCPICFTIINDSLLLEQHLALSHAKDVTYKCGICTFVCQYHGDYLTHMKNHFPGPPYKCDYCEHTTDQISKLLPHRTRHSDEMVYQCTFCSFKCRVKQNLLAHLKLHTADRQFKCDTCNKGFRFRHSLEQHMMSHTTEKTLSCDSCGFTTKFLSHMIAHKRMHSGDVYRCSFPHCKYSTSKKAQLTTHAKTHSGVRPHSCSVCGRGFMEKSHLVRHERIHLDDKPFKCSQCDYASSRRDKLKEHFTRHHGENASAKVPYKARPVRSGNSRSKNQVRQQETSTTNNSINFNPSTNNTTPTTNTSQPMANDIQELIMHHQNHTSSTSASALQSLNHNYPHFDDFHHHHGHHNLPHQLLQGHGGRGVSQHQSAVGGVGVGGVGSVSSGVSHHMLAARTAGHPSSSSTAAAVAAAMMLDPRFHHNSSVPYHPNSTPVSMAMAAVQSSQQIQASGQHGDYPPSLQNCMTLF